MTQFFSNDFSQERWKKAALKNAFALLGKQRFTHAAAFFLLSGLVVLGLSAFIFFWARAKLTGKPFGPTAQFEKARADMEAQFKTYRDIQGDGPILNAQKTPDGWSVED